MKRTKVLRRRCDLPACGKLYRYSDPRSRTCSSSCRQRLCRSRKKAADQVAQEQVEAKLHGKYARMLADTRARTEMDSLNRQPAPAPRPPTAPPPPTPTPAPPVRRYDYISEPKKQTVIIKVPNRFPGTSLRRGRN